MKLESLKKDKFASFESNKLSDAFKIVGGRPEATSINGGTADCIDRDTSDGVHTDGNGNGVDFTVNPC